MEARENECQTSQNYISHMKFQNVNCVITILVKFDIHFFGIPWEIFFGITTDDLLHLKPLKIFKKNAKFFKLFWCSVFVHWKLKLLNFLVDSILNYQYAYVEIHFHPWFILFKKEKNFHIKTKENMQQNTEFPRTCSPHCSWRFVCCVQGVVFICGL